jgi:2-polyprenyl-6-methoxyphenol hydroxylase-like FAD-dependent oxidoreductase
MTTHLDIAICGCGPAGLASALLLHRAGHRVRIFERFDRPRPIGSGLLLQPTGLGVLEELGLEQPILELGARIDRLYGLAIPSNRVALDVRYDSIGKGWQAVGIHRTALFNVLHEAALKQSIEIATSTTIDRVEFAGPKPTLLTANGKRLGTFDLIVNALGANSPLTGNIARKTTLHYGALWSNIVWPSGDAFNINMLEQRYRRASHMAGLLPIGKQDFKGTQQAAFFWSLKRSDLEAWRRNGLEQWKAEVAALWPQVASLLTDVTHGEQLTFAQYDHFTAAIPYSQGVVHIGDAAHATSPQLGQGGNMALLDALALSRALRNHSELTSALPAYAKMRRWHVRLFQGASAIFTPFYQSDSKVLPILRDWITAPLSRLPIGDVVVARLVAGMTTAPIAGESFSPLRLRRRND